MSANLPAAPGTNIIAPPEPEEDLLDALLDLDMPGDDELEWELFGESLTNPEPVPVAVASKTIYPPGLPGVDDTPRVGALVGAIILA